MATVAAILVAGQIGIDARIVRAGNMALAVLPLALREIEQVVAAIEDDPRGILQVLCEFFGVDQHFGWPGSSAAHSGNWLMIEPFPALRCAACRLRHYESLGKL